MYTLRYHFSLFSCRWRCWSRREDDGVVSQGNIWRGECTRHLTWRISGAILLSSHPSKARTVHAVAGRGAQSKPSARRPDVFSEPHEGIAASWQECSARSALSILHTGGWQAGMSCFNFRCHHVHRQPQVTRPHGCLTMGAGVLDSFN